ncbi:MAG: zinc-binding dehydrogenase [Armatimonadia bacterium]
MKKIISPEPDKVAVVEVPMPEMGPGDLLIKTVRSLISPGSELNRVRRLPIDPPNKWPNHDLGYAVAGTVADVGGEVSGWQVGDRVVTMQHHQEFVVTPAEGDPIRKPIHIPDGMDWDTAPFILWSRSCYNWTMRGDIGPGDVVAIMGLGLVGLLMTMWARLRGPEQVMALDLDESRLELARRAGADGLVNCSDHDPVEKMKELTGGRLANCTFHCAAGPHVEAFETSQRITAGGGRVVLIGHHSEPLKILTREFLGKDLLGAGVGYDTDPRLQDLGARLLASGRLPVGEIVTHNVPYTMAPEIYDMLNFRSREAGAVLLRWD